MSDNESGVDIYRDTPVRLLGYTNEVGESFRALIHKKWVHASYGVASVYVIADTIDKGSQMYKKADPSENPMGKTFVAAVDTLLWQAFASLIIPGFTINRICATSLYCLKRSYIANSTTRKWISTGLGLACIPFIVHPIDSLVTAGMDVSYRKWLT